MRRSIVVAMLFFALAACGNADPPDTVSFLMKHPDRLHAVEQQCAKNPKTDTAECNAASEARRRLFMGNGPQYTPPKKAPKF